VPDSAGPPPERSVEVPLRRLPRWLDGFAGRHGPWRRAAAPGDDDLPGWHLEAADGARATVRSPDWLARLGAEGVGSELDLGSLAALRPRFGAVLIRRAGYAVGLFEGAEMVDGKVGSRHIHGRTAAGGWSQQRYARRRANQADEIAEACARAADRILGVGSGPAGEPTISRGPTLFLVTGGDRSLVGAVLDRVAQPVAALPVVAHVGIGTPDATVLAKVPDQVLAVRIEICDPDGGAGG
jgi:hypothetical protein